MKTGKCFQNIKESLKKSADEHLSYFYNYIMCDIYECEFKLVGRKMANLKLGNILLGGCSNLSPTKI